MAKSRELSWSRVADASSHPVFIVVVRSAAALSARYSQPQPVISALPPLALSTPVSRPSPPVFSLQSCVRSRLIEMWPFSTDMWDKFLFDTLVANSVVLSFNVFRSYDERLKPLTLQLLIQIFMTIVGSWLTNSVFFIGIANPFPFTFCCTAYSIYSVWNILRDGPEEDFLEFILFNVGVAAMVKMSEKLV